MGRIVLDISTLYLWTTRDVGITRTERMLAIRLLSNPDSTFVRYDRSALTYVDVPRSTVSSIVAGRSAQGNADVTSAGAPPIGWKRRTLRAAKQVAIRAERIVPAPARADYWAGVRHLRLAAKRSLPRNSPALGAPVVATPNLSPCDLRASDTYVSVGLDWDSNSYSHLYGLKHRIGFKVILTCYDLIPVMFPQYIGSEEAFYGGHFVDLVHTADVVACISETSKRDLLAFTQREGLPTPPAKVILLGADFSLSVAVPNDDAPMVDGAFVLMVGTIEPRKNHRLAFALWERLAQKRGTATPKLIVVGRQGWRVDDLMLHLALNPALRDVIEIKHDVSDGELTWLYENCRFTILPSLYEGWGLPVVESTAHGKVCVASTAPAVVEAGLGAAIHIDTFDQPAWLAMIEELLDDPASLAAHERRVEAVRGSLAERLSWDRYVLDILALADSIADTSSSSVQAP